MGHSFAFNLFIIFFLVGLNGFFVATEFALVSIRRSRVDELVAQGRFGAVHVQRAIKNLDRYIAGTQVGITLASLGLGWLGEPVIARALEPLFESLPFDTTPTMVHSVSFTVGFLFITMLHVVIGELIPKSVALQQPEKVSLYVSWPMSGIILLLYPLIWTLNGLGNWLLRLMGMNAASEHHGVHSVEELEILVNQSRLAGVFDLTESEVVERSFRFSELTAKDVMVRRVDIIALDVEKDHDTILDEAANSNHSRLPLYRGSLDKIVGILHIRDLFRAYRRGDIDGDLETLSRPLAAVPESIHLDDLLDFFRKQRTQTAVVVDEYGGTAGLVTYEDVVEEVTGEVEDEFEAEVPSVQRLADGRFTVRGDLRLDELESEIGMSLGEAGVDDDVDTIAGLIMKRLGRVARVDDEVKAGRVVLKVIDMARMRITRVSAVVEAGDAPVGDHTP